jgi:hypothetical protein
MVIKRILTIGCFISAILSCILSIWHISVRNELVISIFFYLHSIVASTIGGALLKGWLSEKSENEAVDNIELSLIALYSDIEESVEEPFPEFIGG